MSTQLFPQAMPLVHVMLQAPLRQAAEPWPDKGGSQTRAQSPQLALSVLMLTQVVPQTLVLPSAPQAQTLSAPHKYGMAHIPHAVVRAALQLSVPITLPQFFPSLEQKAGFVSGTQP